MSDASDLAVVTLTNTTDGPMQVILSIGGAEHEMAVLGPGESVKQITSAGVSWRLAPAAAAAATSSGAADTGDDDDDVAPDQRDTKGGRHSIGGAKNRVGAESGGESTATASDEE